jgi:predicted amino acid racemase/D-alanyl-D-alanine dipeptidase
MRTPRIEINLTKIAHNAKTLKDLYGSKGIDIIGVTKVVCGDPDIAATLVKSGINILADSRIANIKKMRNAGVNALYLLLRTPSLSQAEEVVKYTDISLNSELSVIKKLSKFAVTNKSTHKIILMVELGDLREGIMPVDLDDTINHVLELKGIELVGLGTNLACFGGIKPDKEKMELLSIIASDVEKKFDLKLTYISGGNSANYSWFKSTTDIARINNLRIGESIYLGCETLHRKPIPGLFTDAFTLVAEVIESKIKPSLPYGDTAQDAMGNVPKFQDQGEITRSILNIGMQDVSVSGLTPRSNIDILGASSDHLIVSAKKTKLKAGIELEFDLNYGSLLSAMTSPYVIKKKSDFMTAQKYCEMVEHKYRLHEQLLPTISIEENNSRLISLKESDFKLVFEPSIKKEYYYMVREEVYFKIGLISKILYRQDKKLVIRSAWRSFEHQKQLWDNKVESLRKKYPNKQLVEIEELVSYFIAPQTKSMHSTGGAVDALIYDIKEDCILDFGTNKGLTIDLNDNCYPYHPHITPLAKKNRKLLIDLFEEEDFVVDIKEYWHFDYGNASWAVEKGENHAFYGSIANKSTELI